LYCIGHFYVSIILYYSILLHCFLFLFN
jgi:hypothetical protein